MSTPTETPSGPPELIHGDLDPSGIPVITLTYGRDTISKYRGSDLSQLVVREYEKLCEDKNSRSKSLVVNFDADFAPSPVIRALVDVNESVNGRKGKLICSAFPKDYVRSLHLLGITNLPSFRLARNKDEAIMVAGGSLPKS